MPSAARYADQIAGFHLDGKHRPVARVDVDQAAALDDIPHLIFVVPMLL